MADYALPLSLVQKQDSRFYSRDQMDSTIKSEMESGSIRARPRTTRPPLKKFTTGFSSITQSEINDFEAFFDIVGKHAVFDWIDPTTLLTYEVRITDKPVASYKGMGGKHLYDIGPIGLQQI